jgi:hypothetical protein
VKEPEDCDAPLFDGDARNVFVSDTYDPGSSFYVHYLGRFGKTFCSDCYERLPHCSHCGEHWDFDDDVVFIEEDEDRCKDCTSFKQCDSCNEWVNEGLNEDDLCADCAPDQEEE